MARQDPRPALVREGSGHLGHRIGRGCRGRGRNQHRGGADPGGRLRVRLAADFERLEFLRVLRHHGSEKVNEDAAVVRDDATGMIAPLPFDPATE